MGMNVWMKRLAGIVGMAAVAIALGPATGEAGGGDNPKAGSYAAAGFLGPSPDANVALTFQAGQVEAQLLEYAIPGCSSFATVQDATVTADSFSTTSMGPMSEENTLEGEWISRAKIRGTLTLERPDAMSCGDPGTYVFDYKAKRYGKP